MALDGEHARSTCVVGVTVPLTPHTCLRPNARCHRLAKADHARELRTAAKLVTADVLAQRLYTRQLPESGPLWLDLVILWERGRKRLDFDGAVSSCKPLIDGIFDALGTDDARIAGIGLRQEWPGETQGSVHAIVCTERPWIGEEAA